MFGLAAGLEQYLLHLQPKLFKKVTLDVHRVSWVGLVGLKGRDVKMDGLRR